MTISLNIEMHKYIHIYVLEIVIEYQKDLLDKFINGMYGYCEEINKYINKYVPIEANCIRVNII